MAGSFDPYHKWLGISPKDQPPNHYRLLGIELFESDPDVIEGAADQRMAHVRTFQTGQNSALSQRLLNELSAAKLCLLNPQKKADYDRQCRETAAVPPADSSAAIPRAAAVGPLPQARPLPVEPPIPLVVSSPGSTASVGRRVSRKPPAWRQPAVLATVAAAALVAALAVSFMRAGGKPTVTELASKEVAVIAPRQPDRLPDPGGKQPDKTPPRLAAPVDMSDSNPASSKPDGEVSMASSTSPPLSEVNRETPPPVLAGKPVDVLRQLDPKRDAVTGDWQMTDGALVSPDAPFSRLMLPPPPGPEYQLTVVGERVRGNWGLSVALVVDGHPVLAEIDGETGYFAGLNFLDGKNCRENETSRHGRVLMDGKPATIIYTVRRRGIHVSVDGQTIIDWRGDPTRLSMHDAFRLPDAARLALCEFKTVCRITKIELASLAPEAKAEAESPPVLAGKSPGLLKVFEDEPDFVDALTAGEGEAELSRNEVYSGTASVRVTGKQRFCEALPGLNVQIRKQPAAPDEYRYLRFAWKKRGGMQIMLQLHYPGNWFRYCAGRRHDAVGGPALKVAGEAPEEFVEVTRDLAADFGEFTLTGLALTPGDGEAAWFDHVYLARTLADFNQIEVSPGKPSTRKFADLAASKAARLPAPGDAVQKQLRQELLKTLAAAKTPAQKRELAQQLMGQAAETDRDASAAFVRLREAAELAEAAGDLDLAWQAIDETAERYAIDAIARRQQSLTEIGKGAKSPAQAAQMAEATCRLTADALAADQAAVVKKVAAQAQSFARRAKDPALVKEIALRMRDAGKLAAEREAVSAARETLKNKPDDALANFTVGRHAVCAAADWEEGLPLLAKGDDADWQKLAQDDLALSRESATVEQQLALAAGWRALAEKQAWPGRHYLRCRAVEWLRRAWPSLSGKIRLQAHARLKTLLAADDGLPDWKRFDVLDGHEFDGYLRLNKDGALRTPVDYDGPIDVTFVARTCSLNIRLYAHNNPAVIWNWEVKPSELRVARPNGESIGVPVTPLQPDRWYTFRYVVTPRSMTITVDGAIVFTENYAYGKLPQSMVSVHGFFGSIVDVKKLVVKPL